MQFRGAVGEVVSVIVTCTSSQIERASPITSKPGPILAEEQGTSVGVVSEGQVGCGRR
jgi:hypothetical protein